MDARQRFTQHYTPAKERRTLRMLAEFATYALIAAGWVAFIFLALGAI